MKSIFQSTTPLTILSILICTTTVSAGFVTKVPAQYDNVFGTRKSSITTTSTPTSLYAKSKERKTRWENQNEMLNSIEKKSTEPSVDLSGLPEGPPNADPLADFVSSIVQSGDERKAESIRAIRVSKLSSLCSFIVLLSGNSRPQNQAISKAIQDTARDEYGRIILKEGTAESGWILLDYGDVMVHIMTPRSRLFYDLEGKWKDGEEMDLTDILIPNDVVQDLSASSELDEEDDPFWS